MYCVILTFPGHSGRAPDKKKMGAGGEGRTGAEQTGVRAARTLRVLQWWTHATTHLSRLRTQDPRSESPHKRWPAGDSDVSADSLHPQQVSYPAGER